MKATKRKKMTQATKIRQYMAKHPNAMPMEIAEALGVKIAYVNTIRWADKKKAQANKTTVSASEVIAAQKAGVGIEEYAKIKIAGKKAKSKLPLDSMPQVGDSIGGLTLTRSALPDNTYAYRWVRDDLVKSGKVQVDASLPASLPEPELPITMEEPKHDPVNHPAHYKVGGIETIDFIEAKKLGYNLGNVVKYITRADHKGNTYEDLCKARWYLNREINSLAGEAK